MLKAASVLHFIVRATFFPHRTGQQGASKQSHAQPTHLQVLDLALNVHTVAERRHGSC
jgi:hypothetical protein